MRRLMLWIIDHPKISVGLWALATVGLFAQAFRLEFDVSVDALMPETSAERDYYENIVDRFGSDDLSIVVLKADDVFTTNILGSVERLSHAISRLEGVSRVESLTHANTIKGGSDWIDTSRLVDTGIPTDAAGLARIRSEALSNPVLVGNLVSADARATAVLAFTDADLDDGAFDHRFAATLESLIEEEARSSTVEIYQIGHPYIRAWLAERVLADQARLLPTAVCVLLVVLCLAWRASHAATIPLVTSLISVGWAFGWMGLFGYPVTILSGTIPVLLICIGFTEDIHFISEYERQSLDSRDRVSALRAAAEHQAVPMLVTSLTTAVSFASLSVSDIRILKELGHVAPLAFASNFLVTIVLVPTMLRYWPAPMAAARDRSRPVLRWFDDRLVRVARFNARHRRAIFAGTGLFVLVGLVGAPFLVADNDVGQFFRPESEVTRRIDDVHTALAGAVGFNVIVEATSDAGLKDPTNLHHVAAIQRFLADQPGVSKTVSIVDYLATMHREMHGGDPDFATIPPDRELVAQYLNLLHDSDVSRYIDFDYESASIIVRHNVAGTRELRQLLTELDAFARDEIGDALAVRASGEALMLMEAADELSTSMVTGLAYTILVVGIVNAILFMSVQAGVLSLIPNLVPVLFIVGVMGLLGIPLSVGTAMIAAVAVGVAVDDTVHYMARNSAELDRLHDQGEAMVSTVRSEGRAIITTSLGLAAGLSTLATSSFVPIAHFGVLSAIVMLVALLVDLTVTPALMASTRLTSLWHVVMLKLDADLLTMPLFGGLTRFEARQVVCLGLLVNLDAGEYAVRQGDRDASTMFMVVSGNLRVARQSAGRQTSLATLGPGDVFGEMALVDRMERSANVIAESDAEVLRLGISDLDRLRRRFPRTAAKLSQNLSCILSRRLRAVSGTS